MRRCAAPIAVAVAVAIACAGDAGAQPASAPDCARHCVERAEQSRHGVGVARDSVVAARLLERACELHEPRGCRMLAVALTTADGIAIDSPRALALFASECHAGDRLSCWHRAELAGDHDAARAIAHECDFKTGDLALCDELLPSWAAAHETCDGCARRAEDLCNRGGIAGCAASFAWSKPPQARAAHTRLAQACDFHDARACELLAAPSNDTLCRAGSYAGCAAQFVATMRAIARAR